MGVDTIETPLFQRTTGGGLEISPCKCVEQAENHQKGPRRKPDDGTNKSITISSPTGNLFFRLAH
jgi:hypothetical protein